MRTDKKGIIDLPVKLMVVVLIISVSVPLLTNAMERGEMNNATSAMNSDIDKIFNAAAAIHYSGAGASRTVSLNIPEGCEIVIPGGEGSDSYSVITFYKGNQTSIRYMDRPPVRFVTDVTISGQCMLLITGNGDTVTVSVI